MKNGSDPAERVNLPVMHYHGELFVPHYTMENIMVARGGMMMHWKDLKRAKAVLSAHPLWPRPWIKEVS